MATSAAEMQAKISKTVVNMDRFDGIINGDVNASIPTDNGIVPSVANAISQIIDVSTDMLSKNTAQGRLSLSSATPIPAADMTSTSIYYHPIGGNLVPIWSGAGFLWHAFGDLLTLPLDANTGHTGYAAADYNYDLYVMMIDNVVRLVHVGSWATGAVLSPNIHKERSTGAGSVELEKLNGILVNKNTLTARFGAGSGDIVSMIARTGTYIGTFRATANGQAKDAARQRLLYNVYNQISRPLKQAESTASWAYSIASYAIMNGSLTNQIEVLFGLESNVVDLFLDFFVSHSTATPIGVLIGLGVDSLTEAFGTFAYATANQNVGQAVARYAGNPSKGLTAFSPLTRGAGSGTQTWWAGSGMQGEVTL